MLFVILLPKSLGGGDVGIICMYVSTGTYVESWAFIRTESHCSLGECSYTYHSHVLHCLSWATMLLRLKDLLVLKNFAPHCQEFVASSSTTSRSFGSLFLSLIRSNITAPDFITSIKSSLQVCFECVCVYVCVCSCLCWQSLPFKVCFC